MKIKRIVFCVITHVRVIKPINKRNEFILKINVIPYYKKAFYLNFISLIICVRFYFITILLNSVGS